MKKIDLSGLSGRTQKRYYREQEKEARENYKKRKGLKIARGFEDSPEAKKVKRNVRQAERRIEKKKIKSGVLDGELKTVVSKVKEVSRDRFFWETLTSSGSAIQIWRDYELIDGKIPGITLFGVIVDYNGVRKVYYTEFSFAKALSNLARQAAKLQVKTTVPDPNDSKKKRAKTTYYPLVNITIVRSKEKVRGQVDEVVYIVVEGEK